MAIYRNISISFWTDCKVEDDFSAEDRYVFLYLLTNPYTNLSGCYELSFQQVCRQTGYTIQNVETVMGRLENNHNVIKYCRETHEVLILKWGRYNWTRSEKLSKPINAAIGRIKHKPFQDYVREMYSNIDDIHTVSIPYPYGSDTTVSVSVSVTDTVPNTPKKGVRGGNNLEQRFNTLWVLYPRKQGRADALKAYERAVKAGVKDEDIRQGIENYVRHIADNKIDAQYIKQGSTFFSKQAWADDYKVSVEQTDREIRKVVPLRD